MITLVPQDLSFCVRRLDARIADLLKANPGKVFLAGGFIRSVITREAIADVDLFISTPGDLDNHLRALTPGIVPATNPDVVYTANAATLRWRPRVQIIHRWTFESATQGIERFDFTIARAAIWFDGAAWQSVCHDDYYADIAAKRIVYCAPQRDEEAGGSLLRLLKFYRRGYTASLDTIAAILARISGHVEALDEIRRTVEFTRLLREVDPSVVIPRDPTIPAAPTASFDEEEELPF